jgi:flagellar hook-associated protein 3 FlgL
MSIDRVATASQSALFLAQLQQAGSALQKTQTQIASGKLADSYAGYGDKAQILTATLSAGARNSAYQTATSLAATQVDLQDTQLTSLSDLAARLKKAVSDASGNNNATTLMDEVQSIFQQATAILNSKDANGDYIYAGGRTDQPPVTVSSLDDLVALGSVSGAFANGDLKKSVQVADGVSVTIGVTASDVGTGLMQALKDVAAFDAGTNGNFAATPNLTGAQASYLGGAIAGLGQVGSDLTAATAANGFVANRLADATAQQGAMDTLYSGFADKLQNTDMATAATQLSLNQVQLQAALQMTASLGQLSLLNYLPISGG